MTNEYGKKITKAAEAYAKLVELRTVKRNIDKALKSNIPKHKAKKYQSVILKAHIDLMNADNKAAGFIKRLNPTEFRQFDMLIGGQ